MPMLTVCETLLPYRFVTSLLIQQKGIFWLLRKNAAATSYVLSFPITPFLANFEVPHPHFHTPTSLASYPLPADAMHASRANIWKWNPIFVPLCSNGRSVGYPPTIYSSPSAPMAEVWATLQPNIRPPLLQWRKCELPSNHIFVPLCSNARSVGYPPTINTSPSAPNGGSVGYPPTIYSSPSAPMAEVWATLQPLQHSPYPASGW